MMTMWPFLSVGLPLGVLPHLMQHSVVLLLNIGMMSIDIWAGFDSADYFGGDACHHGVVFDILVDMSACCLQPLHERRPHERSNVSIFYGHAHLCHHGASANHSAIADLPERHDNHVGADDTVLAYADCSSMHFSTRAFPRRRIDACGKS